jgi:hypothetical protein
MTAKKIDANEIAFAICYTTALPDQQQLQITTSCPQSASDKELRKLISRMASAGELLSMQAGLRSMELSLERCENDLATVTQQIDNFDVRNKQEWEDTGRKGDYRPSQAQKAALKNFQNTEQKAKEVVKRLRVDISDLKKRIEAEQKD